MHILLSTLAQSTPSTTVAKSTSSSGSLTPYLVLILIFAGGYFLFIRPRNRRTRAQQATLRQVGLGDEVMSAGGIFGTVVSVSPDSVGVEVSPGVVMTFLPRMVSRRPNSPAGGPPLGAPPAPAGTGYEEQQDEPEGYDEESDEYEDADDGEYEGDYESDDSEQGADSEEPEGNAEPPQRPGSPRD
ncbi:MAG: preprotein translocase subunit YajC [Acidimicrobiales bacterium]